MGFSVQKIFCLIFVENLIEVSLTKNYFNTFWERLIIMKTQLTKHDSNLIKMLWNKFLNSKITLFACLIKSHSNFTIYVTLKN